MMQAEVRQLEKMFRANGMSFAAESYATMGLVPRGPASEVAWLEANCLGYKSAPDPEIERCKQRAADKLIVTTELREKFSMIFATVWTDSPDYLRETAQKEIDLTLKTDRAINWTISKVGYLPKFPTDNKGAMEREAMDLLTAWQVELEPEDVPTMAEAMDDPEEHLNSMASVLLMGADPMEAERV